MAMLTEERPRSTTDDQEVASTRPDTREWLGQEVTGHLALIVGLSWYALYTIIAAIEPPADHPDAIPVWLQSTLDVTLLGLLAVTAVGLVMRRRFGLVTALGAAGLLLAMVVACPVSGHHTFGTWWYGEMACALGLVAVTGVALNRS
jgi:peptidoglycan/LPS O-acetylase OafA/YrhL